MDGIDYRARLEQRRRKGQDVYDPSDPWMRDGWRRYRDRNVEGLVFYGECLQDPEEIKELLSGWLGSVRIRVSRRHQPRDFEAVLSRNGSDRLMLDTDEYRDIVKAIAGRDYKTFRIEKRRVRER